MRTFYLSEKVRREYQERSERIAFEGKDQEEKFLIVWRRKKGWSQEPARSKKVKGHLGAGIMKEGSERGCPVVTS